MFKSTFPLLAKKQLTHDVYELTYAYTPEKIKISEENLPKPGQYVMFQLTPGLNRSYSLASATSTTFTLIIKRISDGRGSPMICDAEVGTSLSGVMSLGHFVLLENEKSKCFIGTGTGFAPLYAQLLASRDLGFLSSPKAFIFWVREFRDGFYTEEIQKLWESFDEFKYISYFSRQDAFSGEYQRKWYVTDWITRENIETYEEFYLCGSPAMVKDAREKLDALGVEKENIFWEQF